MKMGVHSFTSITSLSVFALALLYLSDLRLLILRHCERYASERLLCIKDCSGAFIGKPQSEQQSSVPRMRWAESRDIICLACCPSSEAAEGLLHKINCAGQTLASAACRTQSIVDSSSEIACCPLPAATSLVQYAGALWGVACDSLPHLDSENSSSATARSAELLSHAVSVQSDKDRLLVDMQLEMLLQRS
jgi:hypothetical protein